jgi:hypothetical protein
VSVGRKAITAPPRTSVDHARWRNPSFLYIEKTASPSDAAIGRNIKNFGAKRAETEKISDVSVNGDLMNLSIEVCVPVRIETFISFDASTVPKLLAASGYSFLIYALYCQCLLVALTVFGLPADLREILLVNCTSAPDENS